MQKSILKILFLFLILQFANLQLFASVTNGTKNLLTVTTEHFDIIYPPSSAATANVLKNNCESILREICAELNTNCNRRFPVVITEEIPILNAYFTFFPANRIVLYNTVSDLGNLSNFNVPILSIFRHELTHAVTMNTRSPFFESLSTVFGDLVSPSVLLYLLPSFTEGIAVCFESLSSEGRLNDPLTMQVVRQAAAEGVFPSWTATAFTRDISPVGSMPYLFGGAFMEFLRTTYGSDKLSDYFTQVGAFHWFKTSKGLFKECFGVSIDDAWQAFALTVEVPENLQEPNVLLEKRGLFFDLNQTEGRILALDNSSSSIIEVFGDTKTRTLYSYTGMDPNLSVSPDASLFLLSYVSDSLSALKILDSEGHLIKTITGPRTGGFVQTKEGLKIVSLVNQGQETRLDLYGLPSFEVEQTLTLGENNISSCFTPLSEDLAAFILHEGNQDRIAILNTTDMTIIAFENPEGYQFRDLSVSTLGPKTILSFSWTSSDISVVQFARYGQITFIEGESPYMELASVDFSGGVYAPILSADEKVTFSAHFFDKHLICQENISSFALDKKIPLASELVSFSEKEKDPLLTGEKYQPFSYLKRGTLVPLGLNMSQSYMTSRGGLGLTYFSCDPTETWTLVLSGGGMPKTFDVEAFPFVYASGRLSYSLNNFIVESGITYSLVDKNKGFKGELLGDLSAQIDIPFKDSDKKVSLLDLVAFKRSHEGFEWDNYFSASYSQARRAGLGYFEKSGFGFTFAMENLVPVISANVIFPRLLPFATNGKITANLPFTVYLSTRFSRINVYTMETDFILFSCEIQKSFMSLYAQRFLTRLRCTANIWDRKDALLVELNLGSYLYSSVVVGSVLSRMKVGMGVEVNYYLGDERPSVSFAFNMDY